MQNRGLAERKYLFTRTWFHENMVSREHGFTRTWFHESMVTITGLLSQVGRCWNRVGKSAVFFDRIQAAIPYNLSQ